jgi:hypothetical protein
MSGAAAERAARWVVEVDEVQLRAVASPGLEWWTNHRMAPFKAWQDRLTVVASAIPGDVVYVALDDQEQAGEWRKWAVEHGCHPKAVTVRRVGHVVTCAGCGERRPYWASIRSRKLARDPGGRCRACYESAFRTAGAEGPR